MREPDVMGVGRTSLADEAGLRSDEFEVRAIAVAARLVEREDAFVDSGSTGVAVAVRRGDFLSLKSHEFSVFDRLTSRPFEFVAVTQPHFCRGSARLRSADDGS